MPLMSRVTGENIDDFAHLRQSIIDILTTPYGSRVAVRDYGCELYTLIDKNVSRQWVIDGFMYIAVALDRWEPRFKLSRIEIDASQLSAGIISLTLHGVYTPTRKVTVLENLRLVYGN